MDVYTDASEIAGPLVDTDQVTFRSVVSRGERVRLSLLIFLNMCFGAGFVVWLVVAADPPSLGDGLSWALVGGWLAFGAIVIVEAIRVAQTAVLWLSAWNAEDPVPITPEPGLRVAVLTTIVPSSEPIESVVPTLRAMLDLEHNGPLDVFLLDEGDDPEVKRVCAELGVRHFSRKGVPEWNTQGGQFAARTKHGNHNSWAAWAAQNGYRPALVGQMDPDHIPRRDFLTRTVGYFRDPNVAFCVAPQVYGNLRDNRIAAGAAALAFIFHGVIQRGMNSRGEGSGLLIGTNHIYRPSAWHQISGYASGSLIEDHLTAMVVYATTNPATGTTWRGIYTPDILSVGEGPTSFTDFFNQQKRWAYGIWEIIGRKSHKLLPRLQLGQTFAFSGLQFFYPSVAAGWVAGSLASGLYLIGAHAVDIDLRVFLPFWLLSTAVTLGTFFYLRRFNLVEYERRWSSQVPGLLITLATIPVYASAAITFLMGRNLTFAVTAKGGAAAKDSLKTFLPHLFWAAGGVVLLVVGVFFGPILDTPLLAVWPIVLTVVAGMPPLVWWLTKH